MANHHSAIKAHKKSLIRAAANKEMKSKIRTFTSKVESAVADQDFNRASSALSMADSIIMKSVFKGVNKINKAARQVKRLSRLVKTIDPSFAQNNN